MRESISEDMDGVALMDTGATFTSIENEESVTNARKAPRSIEMCTQTSERVIDEIADMEGFNETTWFDECPVLTAGTPGGGS